MIESKLALIPSQPDLRPTVMIVDDIPANLTILNALLSKEYRTLVATSGRRALELAGAENPPPDSARHRDA